MIDIKISLPNHGSNLSFKNFHSKNQNHKIKYHINSDIPKADGWIVMEDLKNEAETCEVPKNNIFYLNNETSYEKDYFLEFIWKNILISSLKDLAVMQIIKRIM